MLSALPIKPRCVPVVVLPVIIGYTVFAYRVFWGKSTALTY
jgi:cytochrome bd-type quinol oxidase subunit 2